MVPLAPLTVSTTTVWPSARPHRIGEDPPSVVGRTARRKPDQHGDRVRRIIVGQPRTIALADSATSATSAADETGSCHEFPLHFPDANDDANCRLKGQQPCHDASDTARAADRAAAV